MTNKLSFYSTCQSYFENPINRVKEIGLKGLDKTKSVFCTSFKRYAACNRGIFEGITSRIFTKQTNTRTDFLPTAAILGLGFLTIPSFRIGIIHALIKHGAFLSLLSLLYFINKTGNNNQDTTSATTSNYRKAMKSVHPFHVSVTCPVLEELKFRGLLQNLILLAGGGSVPATLISAILFGLSHLGNDHDGAKGQAIFYAFVGVLLGIENEYYGIFAPIAHHITNNYITDLILFYYGK